MPVTYRVDRERSLALTTAEATLTPADLQGYVRAVLADPDVRPGFNELVDLTHVASLELSTADIASVVGAIEEFGQKVKETRTALVTSDRNAEEISRLYDLFRTRMPGTMRLFRDLAEARAWLGVADDGDQAARAWRIALPMTVHLTVLGSSAVRDRLARVVDISYSGALISCPSTRAAQGSLVAIWWFPVDAHALIELKGTVVRHTETGFAIQFEEVTDELLELLGERPKPL